MIVAVRSRVTFVNRYTVSETSQFVTPRRSSRVWTCACCGREIRRGGLHWQTSNLDGRICATCFILHLTDEKP